MEGRSDAVNLRLDNFMKFTHIVSRPFFTHNVSIEAKFPGKQQNYFRRETLESLTQLVS